MYKDVGLLIQNIGGTNYKIRQISLCDLLSVHKLYNSLSSESKQYYISQIYGSPRKPVWFFAQFFLIISHTPLRNIVTHFFPKYIYYIVGIFDNKNNLLGFAHFVLHGRLSNGKLKARLGIAIKDDFQGKRLGSILLENLIMLAKEKNVGIVFLDVLSINYKGLRIYEKNGFKIVVSNEEEKGFKNMRRNIFRMELIL